LVAVPRHTCDDPVREFGAMTDDLNAMAEWLLACGVDTVALESTGVYWIPVYEVLEQRGLKVFLVDARQMKYVPGRKSDVQDCQWLQRLMSQGYLRAAFRPGEQVCVVRAVARQRDVLLVEQASWVQRMQKALVQMNIQLTEVLTDVMGTTGQAIIRAIVAGERDPKTLARCASRLVLGQHGNAAQARVDAVAEHEGDDAHGAGERHRGLGAAIGEWPQAAAAAAGQHQCKRALDQLTAGVDVHVGSGRMGGSPRPAGNHGAQTRAARTTGRARFRVMAWRGGANGVVRHTLCLGQAEVVDARQAARG
jgi:transposase